MGGTLVRGADAGRQESVEPAAVLRDEEPRVDVAFAAEVDAPLPDGRVLGRRTDPSKSWGQGWR